MKSKLYLSLALLLITLPTTSSAKANFAIVGKQAPHFKLINTEGKKIDLKEYKGKTVVLEWLNHGCPYVKKHYNSGNMQRLQKDFTQKDVIWLSVVSSAPGKQGHYSAKDANKISKKVGAHPTHYLMDPDGTVGRLYGAKTTPHMYIISKGGKLIYAGAIDDKPSTDTDDISKAKNYIRTALNAITSGKGFAQTSNKPYGCSIKYKN